MSKCSLYWNQVCASCRMSLITDAECSYVSNEIVVNRSAALVALDVLGQNNVTIQPAAL